MPARAQMGRRPGGGRPGDRPPRRGVRRRGSPARRWLLGIPGLLLACGLVLASAGLGYALTWPAGPFQGGGGQGPVERAARSSGLLDGLLGGGSALRGHGVGVPGGGTGGLRPAAPGSRPAPVPDGRRTAGSGRPARPAAEHRPAAAQRPSRSPGSTGSPGGSWHGRGAFVPASPSRPSRPARPSHPRHGPVPGRPPVVLGSGGGLRIGVRCPFGGVRVSLLPGLSPDLCGVFVRIGACRPLLVIDVWGNRVVAGDLRDRPELLRLGGMAARRCRPVARPTPTPTPTAVPTPDAHGPRSAAPADTPPGSGAAAGGGSRAAARPPRHPAAASHSDPDVPPPHAPGRAAAALGAVHRGGGLPRPAAGRRRGRRGGRPRAVTFPVNPRRSPCPL